MGFGSLPGGGASRGTSRRREGEGARSPSAVVLSWSPTLLLCLATALVTWSVTSAATGHTSAEQSGTAVLYAPPVPAEQSATQRGRGAPGSSSLRIDKTPRGNGSTGGAAAGGRGGRGGGGGGSVVTAPAATQRLRAVHISVPAIGVEEDLVELAVNGETLQVPQRYSEVGWWRDGPTPGKPGAAVMVGHVDSPTGPAVFYQLSGLTRGQSVVVTLSDRSQQVFKVREAVLYDRSAIPSARVYRQSGRPGLNLLTCGGTFDSTAGAYVGNVVVYTDLVKRIAPPVNRRSTAQNKHGKDTRASGAGAAEQPAAPKRAAERAGERAAERAGERAGQRVGVAGPDHARAAEKKNPWTGREVLGLDPRER